MLIRTTNYIVVITVLLSFAGNSWSDQDSNDIEYKINQQLDKKWREFTHSKEFEERVEQVIVQFIKKQKERRSEGERISREALTKNIAPVDPNTDFIRGNTEAEYSLIEYSDYECPFCKKFHKTAGEFIKRNNQVNWVYRHFPLEFHNPGAQKEAEAAECAGDVGGNDMFWAYSDKIYERTRSNGKGFPIVKLVPLAKELGLNLPEFKRCLIDEKYKQKVLAQFENGTKSGVTGTPGNFLRHNPTGIAIAVHGAQPISSLERVFAQLKSRVAK